MEIDAVVFDYGGVLTSAVRETTAQWLAADDVDVDSFYAVMREWMGREVDIVSPVHRLETGELTGAEFEVELAARLTTNSGVPVVAKGLLTRLFAATRADADMLDLLRALRECGIRVGLLSNSWANVYPPELSALCDAVVISGEVGLRKPNPAIYRLILDQLGIPARHCVFVDDAPVNVEAAIALGMRSFRHVDAVRTRAALSELIPSLTKVAS